MGSKVDVPAMLSLIAAVLSASAASATSDMQFHSSLDNFGSKIFSELYQSKGTKNIISSPFAAQTCLAMLRMGAEGQTATEMDEGLSFTGQSTDSLADSYHSMLAKYEKSDILKIANKVYVKQGYELQDKYNEILSRKFLSPAENIDFEQKEKAASTINTWVESKTNNLIKELIKSSALTEDTRLLLLSAIYFKGNWRTPFNAGSTSERDFHTDDGKIVKVQMMYKQDYGLYYFPQLDAQAVRMRYENSDLSMMVILPNSRQGLAALVEKLKTVPLQSLPLQSYGIKANIRVPKFKAEFEIEMNDSLKKLGINKMFVEGDFGQMLKSPEALAVSKVVQKAVIEVNEKGTEAAALIGVSTVIPKRRPMDFTADHPFYYVIMTNDFIPLFQGTFVGV